MSNKLQDIFGTIYSENVEKIYRFIFFKVGSQEIAEDLTSESFIRGWRAFQKASNPEPKKEIKNPRAFLYQIARNLIADHYREKDRTQFVSLDDTPLVDPSPTLQEQAILESDLDTIKTALVHLKDEYQEVIIWYYLEDIAISEIAQMLDKSEGAVRVTLHRAIKVLKGKIEEV